jgi:hypothetical protein
LLVHEHAATSVITLLSHLSAGSKRAVASKLSEDGSLRAEMRRAPQVQSSIYSAIEYLRRWVASCPLLQAFTLETGLLRGDEGKRRPIESVTAPCHPSNQPIVYDID